MKRPIRRGLTLIEMAVVLTLTAGLMIAFGMLLSSLLRLDRAERAIMSEAVALDRLAYEMRRDARKAIDAKTGDHGIDFTEPDGTIISYRAEKAEVVRVETRDETQARRETFQLTPQARAAWKMKTSNEITTIALSVAFGSKAAIKRYPFLVEATLGADRRFEAKESDESPR